MLARRYWVAIASKIIVILSNFLISVFINRGLGVEIKGEYAYIINLVELLYILGGLGLGQTYSTYKRQKGGQIRGIFVNLVFAQSAFVFLIGMLIAWRSDSLHGYTIAALTALSVLWANLSMIAVIENSVKRNLIQTTINIVYLFILMLLYFIGKSSLKAVLITYALNEVLRIIAFLYVYGMFPKRENMDLTLINSIYSTGIVTMVVMLLISLNYHVDIIMLKQLSSNYHVGIYSAALTFSNMFLLIPDAFKEVLFGDATKNNFSSKMVSTSIKISLGALVVILIGFAALGEFAIKLVYGDGFVESYRLTLILFIGSTSMVFFKILQPIYISHGKQVKAMIFLAVSATINMVLNYIFIPTYNSCGAAIASTISHMVCGLLFLTDYLHNRSKTTTNY